MKRVWLLALALSLNAKDIDILIAEAYEHNYALQAMQQSVEIAKSDTLVSDAWDNPVLSAGVTDVLLSDITDRSLEPMQTQFVALSQTIPLRGKKTLSKEIAAVDEKIAELRIEDQKARIASDIVTLAYKIRIIEEKLSLLQESKSTLKKIKRAVRAYQKDLDKNLEVDQKLSEIDTKIQNLQYQKQMSLYALERLTTISVESVEATLDLVEIPRVEITNHPLVNISDLASQKARFANELAIAKSTPDLKVTGGYYQRVDREDYLNLSFSMPLPVRGKEKAEITKTKFAMQKAQLDKQDLTKRMEKEVETLQKRLESSRENFTRYEKEIVPTQQKITMYLKRKNAIGSSDLTQVLGSINRSILLKINALDELENYFEAYAKMRYYL